MNGSVGPFGPRHAHSLKRRAAHRKESVSNDEKTVNVPTGKQFTFTLDGDTARLVKLEVVEASGERHELSEDEKTQMLSETRESALEALLARAFEAGIQIALGDTRATLEESDDADESEAPEDSALRGLLLKQL